VLFGDHPSLHRGFATIGREIAGHLFREGWPVRYVGYYAPDPAWDSPGYPVIDLEPEDDARERRVGRLRCVLKDAIRPRVGATQPVLLCLGTQFDQIALLEALREEDLRDGVRLVVNVALDYAPLPVQAMDHFGALDAVVPYTRFGSEAILDCARRAGVAADSLVDPIPQGVDTGVFRPPPAEERTRARRQLFGLGEDDRLLAYFGRNSENKRADVVLRLFHLVVSGSYAVCERCGNTSAAGLDRDGRPLAPPRRCAACESERLRPGRPRDDVHVYRHTDVDAHRVGAASGGRDLRHIARTWGIEDRVRFRTDLQIGRGDDVAGLARRMGACDVHVLPFERAGWELTLLETAACGVPNVITEVSAPPEYAAPFSRVVPVGSYAIDESVRGTIDTDLALRAILELLDDPAARRELGQAGVRVARELDWSRVCPLWADLLGRVGRGAGA